MDEQGERAGEAAESRIFTGLAASRGCVTGPVYVFRVDRDVQIPEERIAPSDVELELDRLQAAFTLTRTQVESMSAELEARLKGGAELPIFQGHLMMLADPEFLAACSAFIREGLDNASAAVWKATEKFASAFSAMDDAYLKERVGDIRDISRRIIRNLRGEQLATSVRLDRPSILVAEEVTPAETMGIPREMILGIATARGSLTSHATLLARALGIPAVVGLARVSTLVRTGDVALLDGDAGRLVLHPGRDELAQFAVAREQATSLEAALREERRQPGMTADGHLVPLLANVDPNTRWTDLAKFGAEGIGLYRTEYLWMVRTSEPPIEEQERAYVEASRALPGTLPTTVRLFDLGGDKMLAGDSRSRETNPFLGNRSIRLMLRNPAILRGQLRALLLASARAKIRILYPMVSTIEELRALNIELYRCMSELSAEGRAFDEKIEKGAMIEVPSAALIADSLAQEVDFFSIGTNDLVQYTLATDRSNPSVARLYQPTHPAVVRLIRNAILAAHDANIKISVCGEAAADPAYAALLVGLGVDSLSMTPNFIPPVKKMLRQHGFDDFRALAAEIVSHANYSAGRLAARCRDFAEE